MSLERSVLLLRCDDGLSGVAQEAQPERNAMKNCDPNLLGLFDAILRDGANQYPELSKDWIRDSSRLRLLHDTRGDSFFTLDLPALGKHYDRCIADGRLSLSGLPGGRPFKKGHVIPRLFKGLVLRVFCIDGSLRLDVDPAAIDLLRTLCYSAKKTRGDCSDSRIKKSVQEFFDVERDLIPSTLDWDSDGFEGIDTVEQLRFHDVATPEDPVEPSLPLGLPLGAPVSVVSDIAYNYLHYVCDGIVGGFPSHTLGELKTKHGPGAVSDKPKHGSKYSFPNWPRKLDNQFPFDEYGVPNSSSIWAAENADYEGSFANHEPPSNLLAVPKTAKGPRIIASEPIAHQWIQQGLLSILKEGIDRSALRNCVSLRDQSHNGKLALSSSRTGSHGTLDLSSASDRVSCWLVERCFRARPDLLTAFHASRTRWMHNKVHSQFPRYFRLKKFAAMGSALTFPVQSIIFACASIAAVMQSRRWPLSKASVDRASREVRIYGDDMIVPVDSTTVLIQLLTELGLKVNTGKTYLTGKFRESCGVDAYDGVDVTPAYYKQAYKETDPTTLVSLVQCCNNFFRKGLVEAARFLEGTLPRKVRKNLAEISEQSGAFGIMRLVPNRNTRQRFNRSLQVLQTQCFVVATSAARKATKGSYHLLQYFTERPNPQLRWESGTASRAQAIARLRWVPSDTLY